MISQNKLDNIFISLFTGFSDNTSIGLDGTLLDSLSAIFCLDREKLKEAFLSESSSTVSNEKLNDKQMFKIHQILQTIEK